MLKSEQVQQVDIFNHPQKRLSSSTYLQYSLCIYPVCQQACKMLMPDKYDAGC